MKQILTKYYQYQRSSLYRQQVKDNLIGVGLIIGLLIAGIIAGTLTFPY